MKYQESGSLFTQLMLLGVLSLWETGASAQGTGSPHKTSKLFVSFQPWFFYPFLLHIFNLLVVATQISHRLLQLKIAQGEMTSMLSPGPHR